MISADHVVAVAEAVPGVEAASVEASDRGAVMRVRLEPGADPGDVGVAVGSLVAGAEDLDSAAPTGPSRGRAFVPSAGRRFRPRILRTDLRTDGPSFTAVVELACATRTAVGSGRSALTASGTRRAVATATLHAVEALVARPMHLELEHVERSDATGEAVVLVHLTLVCEEGVQRLSGSAVVREDEGGAVVRAALDALNRRFEAIAGQPR